MHDDRKLVEARLRRALEQRLKPQVYGDVVPMRIEVWHAPGEPVPVDAGLSATYSPAHVGDKWGPAWGTAWFHLTGDVPAEWAGRDVEVVVDLGFSGGPGFSAEGFAYRPDGDPIKGLSPRNMYLPVEGSHLDFYVEAAANPDIIKGFQATPMGDKETAGTDPLFEIRRADIAVRNVEVADLVADIEAVGGLMLELDEGLPRRWEILRALDHALDALDYDDIPGTAAAARAELTDVMSRPAYPSAHRVSAVGHAHIDSAWLWPIRETIRKVGRTMANVTTLAEEEPDFLFVFSQAQQHAWLKEHHPRVWERVRKAVADGKIVPTGSQWIEPDGNMPGGEAMARQIIHGKKFFMEEYGLETEDIWLPDSFGYSAALPQIVSLAGIKWFLTQKISWNQTNKFPHHTFWWEGIDGTRVFTHFPPADTYNATLSAPELAHAQRNYQDKGGGTMSLAPFGYGDGGGGPTREMLQAARRTADLEGSPRVVIEPPNKFFEQAHAEYQDAPVWSGELYLELHRATLTSQLKTKQGNRRNEHLLREAELWSTAAMVTAEALPSAEAGNGIGDFAYPYEDLDRLWKAVLLLQFHDILPGSSIRWVHREAEESHAAITNELTGIIERAQVALVGRGQQLMTFNATPHARDGVPALAAAVAEEPAASTISRAGDSYVLSNGLITATVDSRGLVTSIVDGDREVLAGPANLLQLHPDTPNMWDAWDVDRFYLNKHTDLTDVDFIGEGEGGLSIRRSFGTSTLTQNISLAPGEKRLDFILDIDWHEREKFLKAAFPLDIHTDQASSEIQFGHLNRPTHTNTSWDVARFETCAHRFVHVAEPGYGAAVVNDSTYGHDISRTPSETGATATVVRLSLIRAPLCPDPEADQGPHRMRYALVVGAEMADAVREGYRINLPERTIYGERSVEPIITVDNPAVIVEAVKAAEDESGDVVVRLYESLGGRAKARITPGFATTGVTETDLLERRLEDRSLEDGPSRQRVSIVASEASEERSERGGEKSRVSVEISLRPFQILTLRFARDV